MKPVRSLTLRKETMVELGTGDLALVGAGSGKVCELTTDVFARTRETLTICPNYYCTGTC